MNFHINIYTLIFKSENLTLCTGGVHIELQGPGASIGGGECIWTSSDYEINQSDSGPFGVIIAVIVALIILILLTLCIYKCCMKNNQTSPENPPATPEPLDTTQAPVARAMSINFRDSPVHPPTDQPAEESCFKTFRRILIGC